MAAHNVCISDIKNAHPCTVGKSSKQNFHDSLGKPPSIDVWKHDRTGEARHIFRERSLYLPDDCFLKIGSPEHLEKT